MNQESINHFNQHLAHLPDELQEEVTAIFNEVACHLPDSSTDAPDWLAALPVVLCGSQFIVSLIRRNPAYLNDIITNS